MFEIILVSKIKINPIFRILYCLNFFTLIIKTETITVKFNVEQLGQIYAKCLYNDSQTSTFVGGITNQ